MMLSAAALLPRSARAGEPAPLPQAGHRRLGSLEALPIGLDCMSMVAGIGNLSPEGTAPVSPRAE
jgi:hypothetical protein